MISGSNDRRSGGATVEQLIDSHGCDVRAAFESRPTWKGEGTKPQMLAVN